MKVVWTVPADLDRERIVFFIAQDNPDAAIVMDELFGDAADKLIFSPFKGKPGRVPETREWIVHKSYILVYQYDTTDGIIYIHALLHTSRQWPPEDNE